MSERAESPAGWHFWIDRGGTFTDVVARSPEGRIETHKLLSENPERYDDAALQGMREVLGLGAGESLAEAPIAAVKMGTTVATNALLERKGERTLLLITEGFADALRIGYQNRPDLFARRIVLPELLYERVEEVGERLAADGEVLRPLEETGARAALERARADDIDAVAVVLVHGYRYPEHERRLGELAAAVGFSQISLSHEVSPLMKLVGRGDTTVVDAYLSPILRRYVDRVAAALGAAGSPDAARSRRGGSGRAIDPPEGSSGPRLFFMQSSGGLTAAQAFRGKDSILSGPAGGIVGAVATARAAGYDKVITFDMGGTSTDVAHWAGEYERAFETEVAGVRMRTPMLRIHTVAAGGGSILHFDGQRQRVGPDSAGADPGPACYRRGGPLTVTDANVLLGVLQPRHFPHVFGPHGDQPIDAEVVARRFTELASRIAEQSGVERSPEQVADGFVEIAVANMAEAIRKISVQLGHDVTEYVLHCFGGAGGQHACRVARALGMRSVLIHPLAGVLSAYGMGVAALRELRERAVEATLDTGLMPRLERCAEDLLGECREALAGQGADPGAIEERVRLHLRTEGSDTHLAVPMGDEAALRAEFARRHREQFGFEPASPGLVVEAVAVEAIAGGEEARARGAEGPAAGQQAVAEVVEASEPIERVSAFLGGAWREVPVFRRDDLPRGGRLPGPAIVIEANATTVVEPGWRARVSERGDLVLEVGEAGTDSQTRLAASADQTPDDVVDPVLLEVFGNLFMSVAEQMGVVLQNTAYSVNIKERLDFSCAVFDAAGDLVANAPHMPVHLGSMPESVRTVLRRRTAPGARARRAGDVYMLNSPYDGGTHLPDVTVVTPVFAAGGDELLFFVASRGHHAEIGGITPGSMPPHSTHIDEEGVLIEDFLLVEQGLLRRDETLALLRSGPYPSRNPRHNLGDLEAQIAANEKGVRELHRLVQHFGLAKVRRYMGHVQDNAEESVRRALAELELPPGTSEGASDESRGGEGRQRSTFTLPMDCGAEIRVAIEIDRAARSAVIDFAGTSPQQRSNFNINSAVASAAVLYVFRLLVDAEIPLNGGMLKPLEIRVPPGSLLDPRHPAAVVAGNVETSQAITDALLGALGLMAECQGTMNNFTFGNEGGDEGDSDDEAEPIQYYETICGGAGAGPGFDGASAVHTHMTNTRLTDPEVLEWRFPVLLERFAVRRGSGGVGRWRGGDGVLRRVRFLRPGLRASILSQHREIPPYGLAGGASGAPGRNRLERADGTVVELGATASVEVGAGDVFVIETPGGGGYGDLGLHDENDPR